MCIRDSATTFGGGALTSAVAAKVVRIMKRDHLDERAASLGGEFMESIRRISESHPGTIKEVRGLGLMIGIELAFPAKAVWEELIRRGFICNQMCIRDRLRPTMGTSACAVSAIRGSCAVRVASAPSEDMTPGQIRPPR